MAASWMMFLLTVLSGGGSDLLDYIPSQDYWQAKGVAADAAALVKEVEPPKAGADISKLLIELGAADKEGREAAAAKIRAMGPGVIPQLQAAAAKGDDPEVNGRAAQLLEQIGQSQKGSSVRRLIAIRTLGELKAKEALPALQGLLKSDEMFVADYAKAAIAAIEGKPHERPHPAAAEDVWLLPEASRLVAHLAVRGGQVVDLDAAVKGMAGMMGGGAAPADEAAMRKQMVGHLIGVAEKVGNVRLDGITVGISGDVGPNAGFITLIAHAQYDPAAAAALMGDLVAQPGLKMQTKVVGGTTVFTPSDEVSYFFPSNTHAVLAAGARGTLVPIEEVVAAVRTGNGKLKNVDEMVKLIKTVDTKQPVWGAAKMTDAYRKEAIFAPFETITLVGKPAGDKGDKIEFRLDGKGTDADQVRQSVGMTNDGVAKAKQQLAREGKTAPPPLAPMMKIAGELMESIRCTAEGKDATLTGSVQNTGPGALMMFFMVGVRSTEVHEAPPAVVRPVPAPPPGPPPAPAPPGRP